MIGPDSLCFPLNQSDANLWCKPLPYDSCSGCASPLPNSWSHIDQRMPFSTPFYRPVASWLLVRFQTLNVFYTEGVWEGRQLAKISFRFVLRDHNNSLMGIYILCRLAYSQMRQIQHSDALTFTIIYVYTYVKYCNPKMILH